MGKIGKELIPRGVIFLIFFFSFSRCPNEYLDTAKERQIYVKKQLWNITSFLNFCKGAVWGIILTNKLACRSLQSSRYSQIWLFMIKGLGHTHVFSIYLSYIRQDDFLCLDFSARLRVPPPLDSETGWTGELWSKWRPPNIGNLRGQPFFSFFDNIFFL